MTLSEFLDEMHKGINEFNIYWRLKNSKQPDDYPIQFDKDNAGLWWEMFTDFMESE